MHEFRVATVHALCPMPPALLEVRGEIVVRAGGRLSDQANHPDPMLELDRPAMRVLRVDGADEWEAVEGLALNRDRITVLVPFEDRDPGPEARLTGPDLREVRIKLVCPIVHVTGFVKIPHQATIPGFLHSTRARFLAVTRCRILAAPGAPAPGDLAGGHDFCLVNRSHLIACTEARPSLSP